jgi:hypothetical protein
MTGGFLKANPSPFSTPHEEINELRSGANHAIRPHLEKLKRLSDAKRN